jgi:hypothetical protein
MIGYMRPFKLHFSHQSIAAFEKPVCAKSARVQSELNGVPFQFIESNTVTTSLLGGQEPASTLEPKQMCAMWMLEYQAQQVQGLS